MDFNQCIQLDSRYAKAYLARDVARMHQRNMSDATKDFDRSRELKQQPDLMLQMYILEMETKIKERNAQRAFESQKIAFASYRSSAEKVL